MYTKILKIVQKIYGYLLNPDEEIIYPKSQYRKYIKDVVSGTLERIELIEETIIKNTNRDVDFNRTDKQVFIGKCEYFKTSIFTFSFPLFSMWSN